MVIGTALGFSDFQTIALAVALAFLFGYALTSLPLLRAGFTIAAVIPIALASDTASIAVMEVVDNAIMLLVPGAMEAGLGNVLFWGALSVALVVAGAFALPLNRYLIARGRGHAVVHETGVHGGPSPRLVGGIAVVAAVFGTAVIVGELVGSDDDPMGHGGMAAERSSESHGDAAGGGHAESSDPDPVRGLAARADGLTLELATRQLTSGEPGRLRFQVVGEDERVVRDFEVEHEKRLHLILARRDLTGFQHLHPEMAADGSWSTPITVPAPGDYRVFADFKHEGKNQTLARDLSVSGSFSPRPLPDPATTATTADGYTVRLDADASRAGRMAELAFTVTKDGRQLRTEPYLGAGGHLVALRENDLAYLHTHPAETGEEHGGGHASAVRFETEFPSEARYRLFLQFKHGGQVHTAAFTRAVSR